MRSIGLDIHRDFCEVAIAEGGEVRSPGRVEMRPEALELFAGSLASTDQVALEVSGNAWEVARIIRPHVAKLVVVSPADTGIRAARAKTDRLDARALAKLLAAGSLQSVWVPDDHTRAMRRRLQRRRKLLVVRTKGKQRDPRRADAKAGEKARPSRRNHSLPSDCRRRERHEPAPSRPDAEAGARTASAASIAMPSADRRLSAQPGGCES